VLAIFPGRCPGLYYFRLSGGQTGVRTGVSAPGFSIGHELHSPNGRRPRVRTVWQMDEGAVAPRLITAYPLEA
jgi:hypothetical protein